MDILIGSIMHESNTFSPVRTDIEAFRRTQYLHGPEIVRRHDGQPTELGGVLHELAGRGVGVIPTLSALAMPSGMVTADTYARLRDELLGEIRRHAGRVDGVLLALHGSMSAEDEPDADGALLAAIRAMLPPSVPLAATLDHHANLSQASVGSSDFLVAYRTHPHVDQFEVGAEAARLMVRLISERPRLKRSFVKLPLLTPAEKRPGPIPELADEVRRISGDTAVFTASYLPGYPYSDVAKAGASALVVTVDDAVLAEGYARQLATRMWSMRADYAYRLYTMEEVVEQRGRSAGPVVADELADCTLGGSSGDVVTSVRYLLEHHIADSLAVGIVDPESVSHAFSAGVGATVDLSVGGRVCIEANPPLAVRGRVIATGEDVVGHGTVLSGYETRVGKVAVVEQDGIQIVLIERPGKIDGPSFLEPLGIDPAKKAVVVVKEGLLPLVSYASIASAILMVDSPGFCRQHLPSLGYRNVMRPIYPLDLDVTWGLG